MRRSKIPLIFALLAAFLCIAACGGQGRSRDHANGRSVQPNYATNGTFTMVISDDVGTYDPYRVGSGGFDKLAYDSLVNVRPDGKFVSGLAQKWTADARVATFTLRPDVTCSDGTPLTASQVAADLTYLGDPKNSSPQYGVTVPTLPFRVTADDESKVVTVRASRPFGFLLNTIGQAPIMCAKGLRNPKLLQSASDGTGPFVLAKVIPGQSYTFTVRANYRWGPDGASTSSPGTPKTVVVKVIANETTAANLLLSGQLNLARINSQDAKRLDAQGLDKFAWKVSGAWLWFNHMSGHLTADETLRRALIQAINLTEVVKVNTGGGSSAATGLNSLEPRPCPDDNVSGHLPEYNAAAADQALADAGWSKQQDGIRHKNGKSLTLNLHYWSVGSPFNKPTAELLAQRWRAIGVQVRLSGDTAATLAKLVFQTSDYDVYMQGFDKALPSQMVSFLSGAVPPKGTNISGIDNKGYNELAAKAAAMTPPGSCKYWSQAEQALYRNVDIVPIADRPWIYYLNKAQARATGFESPIPTSIRVLK